MNIKEIKEIAMKHGIKAGKIKKDDLIRTIQRAEGNFACFGSATLKECSQMDCIWRGDCLA